MLIILMLITLLLLLLNAFFVLAEFANVKVRPTRVHELADGGGARAKMLLLTPISAPHFQVRLLARISGLMQSEYLAERLREARDPQALLEIIRAADPAIVGKRMPGYLPAPSNENNRADLSHRFDSQEAKP